MQRCRTTLFAILLLALMAVPSGAVWAQDGLSASEQAALDSARRAIDHFFTLDTYTVEHTQALTQQIGISLGGQSLQIDQQIAQQGTTVTERQPDNRYDNIASHLDQTLTQTLSTAGQTIQSLTVEQTFEMIVLDDRAYLRVQVSDPALADFFPEGWQDVTSGAGAFPGMELYNIDQLLNMGSTAFSAEMFEILLSATVRAETLEPETLDGVPIARYRLTLDPAQAFSGANAQMLRAMFNEAATPFDVDALIELIFTDDDTTYVLTLWVDDEAGVLHGYEVALEMDITIPGSMITDPTLSGAEMSLAQDSVATLSLVDLNEPVEITAPPLGE